MRRFGFILAFAAVQAAPVLAAAERDPAGVVPPGGIVRWAGSSLLDCSRGDQHWKPLDDACWYPVDLDDSGTLELVRRSTAGIASRRVRVAGYPYPEQRLTVEEKYVAPPPNELDRIARESTETAQVLARRTPRRFVLPLAPPLDPLPPAGRFGARRVFNGEPRNPHSGADFEAAAGTAVHAVAEGVVALAADQYFAGRAVYIDHGDGLISMSFHLSRILVRAGEQVRRGQVIGFSGATGRVTGPHLHFGLRWHGARVDPTLLLQADRVVDVR